MGLFGTFKYDLARNKISPSVESLKKISLTLFIEKLCRDGVITDFINKNITNIRKKEETHVNFEIANEMTELLTKKNIFESEYFRICDMNRFRKFIKETVCFIALQIFDLLIKETVSREETDNVLLLMRNLTITREGTIDLKKTVHWILRKEQLSASHSCELACYYFITHEIVQNFYVMKINESIDYFVRHDKEQAVKMCLNFWKKLLRQIGFENFRVALHDEAKMNDIINSVLSDDDKKYAIIKMLEEAVKCNNEIAVHYLWDTYVSKIKEPDKELNKMLRMSTCNVSHNNIDMFFLFHIQSNKLDKRPKNIYFNILLNTVRNVRWHSFFYLTFENFKNFFKPFNLYTLLNTLCYRYFIDFSSQINIVMEYIISNADELKNELKDKLSNLYQTSLKKPLIHGKKDLVRFLLSLGNELYFKEFFTSDHGINLISEVIIKGNLGFVEIFLQERFTRDEILKIKKDLYFFKRDDFYDYFSENRQFDKIMDIIDWFTPERCTSLKDFTNRKLIKDNGLYVRKMIFMPNSDSDIDNFQSLDQFLLKCFKINDKVYIFKRKVILSSNQILMETKDFILCYDELKISILKSKWILLRKFFGWKEFTLDAKRSFCEKLFDDNNFVSEVTVKALDDDSFVDSCSDFLRTSLSVENSDIERFRMKIFLAVIDKYPVISPYIADWYENEMSNEELLIHIEDCEIPFRNLNFLNWFSSR